MATKTDTQHGRVPVALTEEEESYYQQLSDDFVSSDSGEMWDVLLSHIATVLPEGYTLNEDSRIVRLNPDLPDHIEMDGVYGKVRIPVPEVQPHR